MAQRRKGGAAGVGEVARSGGENTGDLTIAGPRENPVRPERQRSFRPGFSLAGALPAHRFRLGPARVPLIVWNRRVGFNPPSELLGYVAGSRELERS